MGRGKKMALSLAGALARQHALAEVEWMRRADALAEQQRVLFMELLSFSRDGASAEQIKGFVDFLSVLQAVAAETSGKAAAPVTVEELRDGVHRAYSIFCDQIGRGGAFERGQGMRQWGAGLDSETAPVWMLCIDTIESCEVFKSSLAEQMAVTLFAIAYAFGNRLQSGAQR
jgi:hypothetical protein